MHAINKQVKIHTDYITLGQLLKVANVIKSGAFAKIFLIENQVYVNEELETRRGRKIYPGFKVRFGDNTLDIVKGTKDGK